MPFKSEKQRRLFYAKAKRGEISRQTLAHWEKETGKRTLPRAVKKRKKGTKKARSLRHA